MKEQDIHSVLWQKRNELRISDDVQHDWFDMQAMLDVQMPVGNPPAGGGGLSGLTGLKLLSVVLATVGVATLIYFAAHKNESKNNSHKNNIATTIINKTAQSTNTTNNKDSLSDATSAGLTNTTSTSANPDKAKPNLPSSSNTTTGNAVVNSASPGNHAAVGVNERSIKGSPVIADNRTTGKNENKARDKDIKNPAMTGNLATPGTGAATHYHHHITNSGISGSDLVRHGRARSPHVVNNSANNCLSKLKGGHSSRKGKNTPLNAKQGGNQPDQYTGADKNSGSNIITTANNNAGYNTDVPEAMQTKLASEVYVPPALSSAIVDKFKVVQSSNSTVKNAGSKTSNSKSPKLEWGILAGVNTAGSFTGKSQNANFYGSLPVDVFFGLFATYNFNDKWGVNVGIRGLNPQTVSGSYNHANESKIDTLQTLNISDSRKVYFVDVPLNLVFKPTPYLSLKAGPVFSLPVKQVNGNSTFQTGKLKKDSLYYVKVTQTINATTYTKSLNTELSFGASLQTGRFVFDAAYIRGLSGLTVGSGLGSYSANSNELLFTVGFKLSRLKK